MLAKDRAYSIPVIVCMWILLIPVSWLPCTAAKSAVTPISYYTEYQELGSSSLIRRGFPLDENTTLSSAIAFINQNGFTANVIATIGKYVYVGGDFGNAGVLATPLDNYRKNIAQYNIDTRVWTNMGEGLGTDFDEVLAIVRDMNNRRDVFAGGRFAKSGTSLTVNNVARWDGSTWNAMGSGVPGTVHTLMFDVNTKTSTLLYAGGQFGAKDGIMVYSSITDTWNTMVPGIRSTVHVLKQHRESGRLYAGGSFLETDDGPATAVALFDGNEWHDMPGLDGQVYDMEVTPGEEVYVVGNITVAGVQSNTAMWDGEIWSPFGGGDYPSSPLFEVELWDESVLVAGDFTLKAVDEKSGSQLGNNAWWTKSGWKKGYDVQVGNQITAQTLNDRISLRPQELLFAEGWVIPHYYIRLPRDPGGTLIFNATCSSTAITLTPASLVFTSDNWSHHQEIFLSATHPNEHTDEPITFEITHTIDAPTSPYYSNLATELVRGVMYDDDPGNFLYLNTIQSSNETVLQAASPKDTDGGYVCVGSVRGSLDLHPLPPISSTAERDALLLGYDKYGVLEWARTYSSTTDDRAQAVFFDPTLSLIHIALSMGTGEIEIDSSCSPIPQSTFAPSSSASTRPVLISIQAADGACIATRTYNSEGAFTSVIAKGSKVYTVGHIEPTGGGSQLILLSTHANFPANVFQFAPSAPSPKIHIFDPQITTDSTGSNLVIGTTYTYTGVPTSVSERNWFFGAEVPPTGTSGKDVVIASMSSTSFSVGWTTVFSGPGDEELHTLITSPTDALYLCFTSSSSLLRIGVHNFVLPVGSERFIIVARMRPQDGTLVWTKAIYSQYDAHCNSLALDAEGELIIVGESRGTTRFGCTGAHGDENCEVLEARSDFYDAWIVRHFGRTAVWAISTQVEGNSTGHVSYKGVIRTSDDMLALVGTVTEGAVSFDHGLYTQVDHSLDERYSFATKFGVGVIRSPHFLRVTEGKKAQYSVSLSIQPSHDVHISLVLYSMSSETAVFLNTSSIIIRAENWNIPVPVDVEVLQDNIYWELHPLQYIQHSVSSLDPLFSFKNNFNVYIETLEDDSAGVLMGSPEFIENMDTSIPFRLASQPTMNVHLLVSVEHPMITPASHAIMFTPHNYNIKQYALFSVSNNDYIADNGVANVTVTTTSADPVYDNVQIPRKIVVQDDDIAGLRFSLPKLQSLEGTSIELNFHLTSKPTSNTLVSFVSSEPSLLYMTSKKYIFGPLTWNAYLPIFEPGPPPLIHTVDDYRSDGNKVVNITYTFESDDPTFSGEQQTVPFTIIDDDHVGLDMFPSEFTATVRGNPAIQSVALSSLPYGETSVSIYVDDRFEVTPPVLFFDQYNWNITQQVAMTIYSVNSTNPNISSPIIEYRISSDDHFYDNFVVQNPIHMVCEPLCADKVCGDNGCGSVCGHCQEGVKCNIQGTCGVCIPRCTNKECGPDTCGGTCPPGCGHGYQCNATLGICDCVPDCKNKDCGDDGCGGACGLYDGGCEFEKEVCGSLQLCECTRVCQNMGTIESQCVCECPVTSKGDWIGDSCESFNTVASIQKVIIDPVVSLSDAISLLPVFHVTPEVLNNGDFIAYTTVVDPQDLSAIHPPVGRVFMQYAFRFDVTLNSDQKGKKATTISTATEVDLLKPMLLNINMSSFNIPRTRTPNLYAFSTESMQWVAAAQACAENDRLNKYNWERGAYSVHLCKVGMLFALFQERFIPDITYPLSGRDCFNRTSCNECMLDFTCGWCKNLNKCYAGDRDGPLYGTCDWTFNSCKHETASSLSRVFQTMALAPIAFNALSSTINAVKKVHPDARKMMHGASAVTWVLIDYVQLCVMLLQMDVDFPDVFVQFMGYFHYFLFGFSWPQLRDERDWPNQPNAPYFEDEIPEEAIRDGDPFSPAPHPTLTTRSLHTMQQYSRLLGHEKKDLWVGMLVTVACMLVLTLLLSICMSFLHYILRKKRSRDYTKEKNKYLDDRHAKTKIKKNLRDLSFAATIRLAMLMYLGTCATNMYYIMLLPSAGISSERIALTSLAFAFLVLYILGFPALISLQLWRNWSTKEYANSFRSKWGTLYMPYLSSKGLFVLLVLLKKFLTAVTISVFHRVGYIQLIVLGGMEVSFMSSIYNKHPLYRFRATGPIQIFLCVIKASMIMTSLAVMRERHNQSQAGWALVGLFIVGLIVVWIYCMSFFVRFFLLLRRSPDDFLETNKAETGMNVLMPEPMSEIELMQSQNKDFANKVEKVIAAHNGGDVDVADGPQESSLCPMEQLEYSTIRTQTADRLAEEDGNYAATATKADTSWNNEQGGIPTYSNDAYSSDNNSCNYNYNNNDNYSHYNYNASDNYHQNDRNGANYNYYNDYGYNVDTNTAPNTNIDNDTADNGGNDAAYGTYRTPIGYIAQSNDTGYCNDNNDCSQMYPDYNDQSYYTNNYYNNN